MTTDLHRQCSDSNWAVACIRGLEGEVEELEARIEAVDKLPDQWLSTRTNEMYTSQQADAMGACAIELEAALKKPTP